MTPVPACEPCSQCGTRNWVVTCLYCDSQSAEELRRSLNLPPPSAHSYKRDSVMEALVKTVAQRDAAWTALTAIVAIEHHNDEPDVAHHWNEFMTAAWCPGCIAVEALASAEKAASSENTGGGS